MARQINGTILYKGLNEWEDPNGLPVVLVNDISQLFLNAIDNKIYITSDDTTASNSPVTRIFTINPSLGGVPFTLEVDELVNGQYDDFIIDNRYDFYINLPDEEDEQQQEETSNVEPMPTNPPVGFNPMTGNFMTGTLSPQGQWEWNGASMSWVAVETQDEQNQDEEEDEQNQDEENEETQEEQDQVVSSYEKKDNYPSFKVKGMYPPGSAKELGLDNVDLEKSSLGNWNSIVKSNREIFKPFIEQPSFFSNLYENGKYLGRPVRVRFLDITPVLTWTLIKRVGGLNNFGTEINGGYNSNVVFNDYGDSDPTFTNHIPEQAYYSNSSNWYDPGSVSGDIQVGPLMPLSRFVDKHETNDVKKMSNFYRTFGNTYKRSNQDSHQTTEGQSTTKDGPHNFSIKVREQIVEIFQEKYNDLKNIIDGATGYIKEVNQEDYPNSTDFQIPIEIAFKEDIQNQINEILNFNVEVFADGSAGLPNTIGKNIASTLNLDGNWYHRFKLYFGGYSFNSDRPVERGYQNFDDKGRAVGTPQNIEGVFEVKETYLPEDSYILPHELPKSSWGGIYLEKLTDTEDVEPIQLGNVGEGGFTNMGRQGESDEKFYFGLSLPFISPQDPGSLGNKLINIGHPFYNFEFLSDVNITARDQDQLEELDYQVICTPESDSDDLLYYDLNQKKEEYQRTSYPINIKLTMDLFNIDYQETPINISAYTLLDEIYLNGFNPLEGGSREPENNIYRYEVIQWGDEKKLLTDNDILNSQYFYIYNVDDIPSPDNFFYKKMTIDVSNTLSFFQDTFHSYNRPGVKSIKIIAYRYDSTGNVLLQTSLVTKNIVINDGLLSSQDFKIFGGTDFIFLPIVENQAIIGGFDVESKYDNSVSKIVKDDSFVQDDYLEKSSAKNYIEKINNSFLGKQPGQLDLGQVRVFKEARDIYDFIGGNKLNWIVSGSDTLPVNSLATDIFIRDNKCVVDLNPSDTEYSAIQNKAGLKEVGVIIGDYKVNQPQGGKIQKEGTMETPILDTDNEKQAF